MKSSNEASKKNQNEKKKARLAFDPNATSMTNAQYQEHLKTLDLKILSLMGISVPQEAEPEEPGSSPTPPVAEQEPEVLDEKPSILPATGSRIVCQRCHSLSHHASPHSHSSNLSSAMFPSPPAPVPKHLKTLAESKSATVVLVVDLVDFPISLPQPIIDGLLKSKRKAGQPGTPIILVGNKFDVMPNGTSKNKVTQLLQSYLEQHGLADNIRAIHLLSAKNPVGDEIRSLFRSIGKSWTKFGKGNVVLVGAENVGKSQLLNAFLKESGRWRPNEQQVQQKRHGTEQQERQRKLNMLLGGGDGQDDNSSGKWAEMTGVGTAGKDMDQYEEIYRGRADEKYNKYKTTVSNVPGTTLERIKIPLGVFARQLGASTNEAKTKWVMDTPGIRTDASITGSGSGLITNWLTLDELKVALPKKIIRPTSFTLEEGKSFFLGGLVRIDCISVGDRQQAPEPSGDIVSVDRAAVSDDDPSFTQRRPRGSNPIPKITCFTTLPLHKTSTVNAEKFMNRMEQGQLTILQPPFGSPERLAAFPGLKPISSTDTIIINQPFPTVSSTPVYDPFARLGVESTQDKDEDLYSHMSKQERRNAILQQTGQYGICDLVFAGVGWVMVSGKFKSEKQPVTLRIWTPAGQGAALRKPALLPDWAANPVDKTSGGIRQKQKLFQALPLPNDALSE
ncbi:hypothetical protein BGW38_003298 [Lunasporangiospora selenospora]|uniref:G domain-containing protein n=1 Tax=Lunasporangiospora selenospora TaxID=979761 RepID=A0A9P6KH07_9FUNG|nr:hypothetical protein BGW38_003298 [Lunasporangiospora selenospora]